MRTATITEARATSPRRWSVPMGEHPGLLRRLFAEAFGTFCLVFAGTGAVVVNAVADDPFDDGGVAAAFGLVVAAMIFTVGHLSGAHLNPAVTLAFAAGRHFPPREVPWYWSAQTIAAIGASMALRGIFGSSGGLGATRPPHTGLSAALILEAGLTALLVTVILAVATDTRAVGSLAAVAIGATIAVEALAFGPITGASMNPARSLGPVVATGHGIDQLWIYLCGPTVGALIGTAVYEVLRGTNHRLAIPMTEKNTV